MTPANLRSFSSFLEIIERNANKLKNEEDADKFTLECNVTKCAIKCTQFECTVNELIIDGSLAKPRKITAKFNVPQSIGLFNMSIGNDFGPCNSVMNICFLFGWCLKIEEDEDDVSMNDPLIPLASQLIKMWIPKKLAQEWYALC